MRLLTRLFKRFSNNKLELPDKTSKESYYKFPPVFAIGTGRSGTHFMNAIMEKDDAFFSTHADIVSNATMDSMVRFCKWNNIPVDLEPLRYFRHQLIEKAFLQRKTYFESNAYLSSVCRELHEWFGAKIILIIRKPENVVNSHYIKGWYKSLPRIENSERIPLFSPGTPPNHYFGRIMPKSDEISHWIDLTQIGRISWWWNTLNIAVYEDLKTIDESHKRIIKIDEFDYDAYVDLHKFSGGKNLLTRLQFENIRKAKPGKGKKHKYPDSWSKKEWDEFLTQTEKARNIFGYQKY